VEKLKDAWETVWDDGILPGGTKPSQKPPPGTVEKPEGSRPAA